MTGLVSRSLDGLLKPKLSDGLYLRTKMIQARNGSVTDFELGVDVQGSFWSVATLGHDTLFSQSKRTRIFTFRNSRAQTPFHRSRGEDGQAITSSSSSSETLVLCAGF